MVVETIGEYSNSLQSPFTVVAGNAVVVLVPIVMGIVVMVIKVRILGVWFCETCDRVDAGA